LSLAASSEPVEKTPELQSLGSIFPIDIVPIGNITIQPSWIIIAVAGFMSTVGLLG